MIDIFLSGASNLATDDTTKKEVPKYFYTMDGQKGASIALLLIALACIPTMLCVKPCIMRCRMKNHEHSPHVHVESESVQYEKGSQIETTVKGGQQQKPEVFEEISRQLEKMGAGHENHAFSEVFIHQLIETIEFVLGTVSNTASYLRLWALSLAHSQLAGVFLENIMTIAYRTDSVGAGGPIMWLCFLAFFTFTFGVLMCMDTLECFLHTLRLHWVEFQNKFYKGTGYKFVPFSFETVLRDEMKRK
jgi:V-type H+-transporting ATPase subunit a